VAWWHTEAQEVITEIRSVKDKLAATLHTLEQVETRLNEVADRQEVLNEQIQEGPPNE
jgi:hypothetical protein